MDNNTWTTSDLYIAAYCLCNDMHIVDTQRHGRKITFVFEDTPGREQLIKDYINNDATVFPRQYKESLQAIKDLIYQGG